ncbi:MAG: hypothetical protein AAF585_18625 [Verrucomicrobiota bacterium]
MRTPSPRAAIQQLLATLISLSIFQMGTSTTTDLLDRPQAPPLGLSDGVNLEISREMGH